jgi:hypothetical protein
VWLRSLLILLALPLALPACATSQANAPALVAAVPAPEPANLDDLVGFLCPMHPDHTSDVAGKCPICGMTLVQGALYDFRDYDLKIETVPAVPKAGETLTVNLTVSHPETGETVKNFELVHDRRYHLFVVSQDMEFFEHIHPQEREDGTWSIDVVLPKPGYYVLLSDFAPSGGTGQFLMRPLVTAGYSGELLAGSAHLVPDTTRTHTVDDLTATVSYDPGTLRAATYGHMNFQLTKTATGESVRELQTYLGSFGHMLIMSEDMVEHVHAHPVALLPEGLDPEELRGGPDVLFEGLMPKAGRYRAWTQFRYQDKLYTFVNTFEVFDVGQRAASP